MPRFVVLEHATPPGYERPLHWDLMLETESGLATWALERAPEPAHKIRADRLGDHRLAYLDYEGEVSGGRGRVTRWDSGQYELICRSQDRWVVRLAGRRLAGELELRRESAGDQRWICEFWPSPV
jgi:hypothetical protein